jgi:hypothetical protein
VGRREQLLEMAVAIRLSQTPREIPACAIPDDARLPAAGPFGVPDAT